ncbi:MAG: biopolymer transporter ExbD [Bacteroidaceae bacterium]|nr:biopolymer transporter ExbD [Candidatus Colenecus caballi]MCQ2072221.1 biopolymer transporter ExbD [Bacteroidaceae bacterium]
MSKFRSNGKREMPELNTSSLPDLIFTVLFFFMMVTSMREVEVKVQYVTPTGTTEIEKLERKSLISHIYIGPPSKNYRAVYGSAPRIQLNEVFAEPQAIREFVKTERESMAERDKPLMRMSMKIDRDVQMGIVTDVKQELRKARALNIVYSATKDKNAK